MVKTAWSMTGAVLFVLTLALCTTLLAFQQKQPSETYRQVKPKPGERCLVCGKPLNENDVALIVRGRRVPLKQTMVDSFMKHQEEFFSKVQPRGALFQENLGVPPGVAQGGISRGWFLFGLYILTALIFSALSGYSAISKGLPATRIFFIGFVFNLLGYIYVLTRTAKLEKGSVPKGLRKVPATNAPVICPKCKGSNHPSAEKCRNCGAKLDPVYRSEVSRN